MRCILGEEMTLFPSFMYTLTFVTSLNICKIDRQGKLKRERLRNSSCSKKEKYQLWHHKTAQAHNIREKIKMLFAGTAVTKMNRGVRHGEHKGHLASTIRDGLTKNSAYSSLQCHIVFQKSF